MTKYHDKHFSSFKNDMAIVGEEEIKQIENKGNNNFICEFCRCTLIKIIDSSGQNPSYYCSHCGITKYDIVDLRSESYIETSDGPVEDPSLSYAPEPRLKRKRKEIKGGLKALQDKGIHISSYKEGVG